MSRYVKGRRLEYRVRDLFQNKEYVVVRAAQSKPVDLVCLKNGRALLVECKTEKSLLSKARKEELLNLAKTAGASLILARRKGRKIEMVELETGEPLII